MTVWIYINTAREVGDVNHLKVFASEEAAERWFAERDPEGMAFEYPVIESYILGSRMFQQMRDQRELTLKSVRSRF